MRIALVDGSKKASKYPVGLLKIGAWKKAEGHECELFINKLPKKDAFDEIWISTLFTFEIPMVLGIIREAKHRAPVVKVGGIAATLMPDKFEGAEVTRGLIPEAEEMSPDYTLLEKPPEYSISYTTRGCVKKCGFCMVSTLEPKYTRRKIWTGDISDNTKWIEFYDNNYTAKRAGEMKEDAQELQRIFATTENKSVDFNQAIDCRLITEEKADVLATMNIKPVRMAFDNMEEDGYFQAAVKMFYARGVRDFTSYVLYNFNDSPQDFYYRMREHTGLSEELSLHIGAFPMRYQPILNADSGRDHVGSKWTARQRTAVANVMGAAFPAGVARPASIGEFEYWFTESPDKFAALLSWTGLPEYMKRKSGEARMRRSKGQWFSRGDL